MKFRRATRSSVDMESGGIRDVQIPAGASRVDPRRPLATGPVGLSPANSDVVERATS